MSSKHEETAASLATQHSIAFKPWRFDTRVQARNIVDGVVTAAELKAHVAALPDVSEKVDVIELGKPGEALAPEADPDGDA